MQTEKRLEFDANNWNKVMCELASRKDCQKPVTHDAVVMCYDRPFAEPRGGEDPIIGQPEGAEKLGWQEIESATATSKWA